MPARKAEPAPDPDAQTPTTPEEPGAPGGAAAPVPAQREQLGGTIVEGGRPVGYTREGALSAVAGGPVDPTIQPGTGTVTDPKPARPEAAPDADAAPPAGA